MTKARMGQIGVGAHRMSNGMTTTGLGRGYDLTGAMAHRAADHGRVGGGMPSTVRSTGDEIDPHGTVLR